MLATCFRRLHPSSRRHFAHAAAIHSTVLPLLHSHIGLSFWGGVCPTTGVIIDEHHPLCGHCMTGKILAIPNARGSCTGSQVVLELLANRAAPAAIILRQPDDIVAVGAIVAEEIFAKAPMPIISVGLEKFTAIADQSAARIEDFLAMDEAVVLLPEEATASSPVLELSDDDRAMLDGAHGIAAQKAMRIVTRVAAIQRATKLIDVTQAHIDSTLYIGQHCLQFAERLAEWGGKVRVPTTMNPISVDLKRWRRHGVSPTDATAAIAVSDAYVALGATPSFTCAPYLLDSAPAAGEHIGWSESNAVLFANSVLGARTQKNADFMETCIALTGRAPYAKEHCKAQREARIIFALDPSGIALNDLDDSFYNTLGYLAGLEADGKVPLLTGLENVSLSRDDLKAFSAAFGTSGSAAIFHIAGHTPEAMAAADIDACGGVGDTGIERKDLTATALARAYQELDGVRDEREELAGSHGGDRVQMVALGNPHFSLDEFRRLAELIAPNHHEASFKCEDVELIVTVGRTVLQEAQLRGYVATLEAFGGKIVSDTCWCMMQEPLVPRGTDTLVTNSAKYAHYAPALVSKHVRFASLERCVIAARTGMVTREPPDWLSLSSTVQPSLLQPHTGQVV